MCKCKMATAIRYNDLMADLDPYGYRSLIFDYGTKKNMLKEVQKWLADPEIRATEIDNLVSYFECHEPGDETFLRIALMVNELTKMKEN